MTGLVFTKIIWRSISISNRNLYIVFCRILSYERKEKALCLTFVFVRLQFRKTFRKITIFLYSQLVNQRMENCEIRTTLAWFFGNDYTIRWNENSTFLYDLLITSGIFHIFYAATRRKIKSTSRFKFIKRPQNASGVKIRRNNFLSRKEDRIQRWRMYKPISYLSRADLLFAFQTLRLSRIESR